MAVYQAVSSGEASADEFFDRALDVLARDACQDYDAGQCEALAVDDGRGLERRAA